MKQINGIYNKNYYLTQNGQIYDTQKECYLSTYNHHSYRLKTINGQIKSISLKQLYREIYDKQFCIDNIQNLQNEEWKEIEGTRGIYYVSNLGRVKSYHAYESIILRTNRNKGGYDRVDINIDGIRQTKLVHLLVAYAFLQPINKPFMQIHHKDLNKNNNSANNLQWISKFEHLKLHKQIRERSNNVSS